MERLKQIDIERFCEQISSPPVESGAKRSPQNTIRVGLS